MYRTRVFLSFRVPATVATSPGRGPATYLLAVLKCHSLRHSVATDPRPVPRTPLATVRHRVVTNRSVRSSMVAGGELFTQTAATAQNLNTANRNTPKLATTLLNAADRYPIPTWAPRDGHNQAFVAMRSRARQLSALCRSTLRRQRVSSLVCIAAVV